MTHLKSGSAIKLDTLSLYAHYVWYCRDNGLQARSKNTFSSAVLDKCNQVLGWREVQKTVNQANSRVIVGISLKGVHLEVRGVQRQEGSSEFEALLLYIMSD